MTFVKLAVRNVGRNKRRTIITMITVIVGVLVVVAARGLLNGLQGEIRSSLTEKVHGDIQIHAEDYHNNGDAFPYDYLVPFGKSDQDAIKSIPGVEIISPRFHHFGLITNKGNPTTNPTDGKSNQTTAGVMIGIDPITENEVLPRFGDALLEGRMIKSIPLSEQTANNPEEMVPEANASDANPADIAIPNDSIGPVKSEILITTALVDTLHAKLGDTIILMTEDSKNVQQGLICRLVGILDLNMPNASTRRLVWVDYGALVSTLGIPDQAAEVIIRTTPDADINAVQATIATKLGAKFEVETWEKLAGFLFDVMSLQNTIFGIVIFIMFFVVTLAIINTSLMTVMERTREIGTMMALGYKRLLIVRMFLYESATIGLLGGIIGLTIGSILTLILNKIGLSFVFPGTTNAMVIHPIITVPFAAFAFFAALASATIAGVYPSWRAGKLRPVEALTAN